MKQTLDDLTIPNKAEKILRENNINSLPVDVLGIANKSGILVQAKNDCEQGVSGMLLRSGDTFGILYSTYYHNEGFELFSIAHELGHYFLEGHIEQLFSFNSTSIHASRAGIMCAASPAIERQADLFAENLLMPTFLVDNIIQNSKPCLESIKFLASKCNTSLTAAAIKYVTLTKKTLCFILSDGEKVFYSFMSEKMKRRKFGFIPKNSRIPPETITYKVVNDGSSDRLNYISQDDHFYDWFECDSDAYDTEEVLKLQSYNKVMTIIHP